MHKFYIILFSVFCYTSNAQIKALTEDGRQVLLAENGTWRYLDNKEDVAKSDSIKLNKHKFTKDSKADFLVKSNTLNVGVYIDPDKWTFSSHKENEKNPEYRFNLKSGDGYAIAITEKTQIPLENLREIALINAQKAAVDARETNVEYRMVNGKKILCLEMKGTIQGIDFVYFGYYFSNENGTIQLLSYSSQQFFDTLKTDLETFLNGLVVLDK